MSRSNQFWMVYGKGAGAPAVKHTSLEAAKAEAERLATKDIGREFYVLAAVFGVKASATVSVIDVGEPAVTLAEAVAAMRSPLQLEVGKTYRRSDGSTETIVRHTRRGRHPLVGESGTTYTAGGRYLCDSGTPGLDLIEEVIEPAAPPKNDDGWISWGGGQCPVAGDVIVSPRCRDGFVGGGGMAFTYRWSHDGTKHDIIAYKVVKP